METPGRKKEKIYHINLLKQWQESNAALLAMQGEEEEDQDADIPTTEADGVEEGIYPLQDRVPDIKMNEIGPGLTEEQHKDLEELVGEFPTLFQEKPGRTTLTQHEITVGDAAPIRQKPYRIPYSQRDVVKKELEGMLEAKVIRPSTSPWSSPVVLVKKKDGVVRFCVDYRKLNQEARFDAYPIPRMEEIFESISSGTIISTLDLAKGYWQIPMAPESREKTAFATPFGLYEFEVMPFGLHNAPATFHRTMNHVLRDCSDFSGAYIDDIVIFSHS